MEVDIINNGVMTESEIAALQENISFFIQTPLGSLPQRRDYGINAEIFDEPFDSFRMKATVDIVTGLRKHFGVNPERIQITKNKDGQAKLKLEFGVAEQRR